MHHRGMLFLLNLVFPSFCCEKEKNVKCTLRLFLLIKVTLVDGEGRKVIISSLCGNMIITLPARPPSRHVYSDNNLVVDLASQSGCRVAQYTATSLVSVFFPMIFPSFKSAFFSSLSFPTYPMMVLFHTF